MPELSVSETQLERLEEIREDLEAAYGGPYSTVRREDALNYLLETYTPPEAVDESEANASEAATVDDHTPAGEAETADPDEALTEITGVGEATAEALAEAGFPSLDSIREANPEELTTIDGIGAEQAADMQVEIAGLDDEEDESSGDSGGSGEESTTPKAGDSPADTLQQAMSLLDQHDDRWRESAGDEPYEVDLPDGSTEAARTKDDIKRLLFKHWR